MDQKESMIGKSNEMGICHSCLQRPAITDYNGEKYYVCRLCLEDLSKKFKGNQNIDPQSKVIDDIPSHNDLSKIVSIQVDINRAVWAGNIRDLSKSSFSNEKERDIYVNKCITAAKNTLNQL